MNQSLLADLIAVFHLAYVICVVSGLFVILLGGVLRWSFTRNFWFRVIHLAMILFVVFEALSGITCPLTNWEYRLRLAAGQQDATNMSFVARLIHGIIFYDFPPIVFIFGYCVFGAAVLAAWFFVPPVLPWKQEGKTQEGKTRDR